MIGRQNETRERREKNMGRAERREDEKDKRKQQHKEQRCMEGQREREGRGAGGRETEQRFPVQWGNSVRPGGKARGSVCLREPMPPEFVYTNLSGHSLRNFKHQFERGLVSLHHPANFPSIYPGLKP